MARKLELWYDHEIHVIRLLGFYMLGYDVGQLGQHRVSFCILPDKFCRLYITRGTMTGKLCEGFRNLS